MIQTIQQFASEHPKGFTENQFMDSLPEDQWSEGSRTLYEMALIDKKLHLDLETGIFIERRTHGAITGR